MTDELKPVKCGCGGEAIVKKHTFYRALPLYSVKCDRCGIQVPSRNTEAEVVEVWNRAMNAGKDDIAITKGTWMMTLDGFHCSVCFYKCETTALPDVCPHCGAKMKG